MKGARAGAAFLLLALAPSGCGSRGGDDVAPPPPAAVGPLPEGIVARVGAIAIHGESVGRIAALQRVDVRAARDLAVRDALFADGAAARELDVAADVRSVLAHRLLRAVLDDVKRTPPTPTELTDAAASLQQYNHVPASLIADEVLEAAIYDARARDAVTEILAPRQAQAERARDADALLALVRIDP